MCRAGVAASSEATGRSRRKTSSKTGGKGGREHNGAFVFETCFFLFSPSPVFFLVFVCVFLWGFCASTCCVCVARNDIYANDAFLFPPNFFSIIYVWGKIWGFRGGGWRWGGDLEGSRAAAQIRSSALSFFKRGKGKARTNGEPKLKEGKGSPRTIVRTRPRPHRGTARGRCVPRAFFGGVEGVLSWVEWRPECLGRVVYRSKTFYVCKKARTQKKKSNQSKRFQALLLFLVVVVLLSLFCVLCLSLLPSFRFLSYTPNKTVVLLAVNLNKNTPQFTHPRHANQPPFQGPTPRPLYNTSPDPLDEFIN